MGNALDLPWFCGAPVEWHLVATGGDAVAEHQPYSEGSWLQARMIREVSSIAEDDDRQDRPRPVGSCRIGWRARRRGQWRNNSME